ncbi:MAG: hypothetical protein IPG53_17060 [Ignavibacteriales bacterium]|nr:hypothetical protein [Ignavibacteriales bacterium]
MTDKDVHLTENRLVFLNFFKADQYTIEDKQDEEIAGEIASKSVKFDRTKLYNDQKVALMK